MHSETSGGDHWVASAQIPRGLSSIANLWDAAAVFSVVCEELEGQDAFGRELARFADELALHCIGHRLGVA